MDDVKINALPISSEIDITDRVVIEDSDGTKTAKLSSIQLAFENASKYATFKDMINSILQGNVEIGMICATLGYHSVNDNGGGTYLVTNDVSLKDDPMVFTNTDLENQGIMVQLLVGSNGYVTVEQFGAYGDGDNRDTNAIKKAISSGYDVRFRAGKTYRVTESIEVFDGMNIDFNGAIIKFTSPGDGFIIDREAASISNATLKNLIIDTNASSRCIYFDKYIDNLTIDNLTIRNYIRTAIEFKHVNSGKITNVKLYSNTGSSPVGIIYGTNNTEEFNVNAMGVLLFDNIFIDKAYPAFQFKYSKNNVIKMSNITYLSEINKSLDYLVNTSNTESKIEIDNAIVLSASAVMYTNSPNEISLKNISARSCKTILSQLNNQSVVSMENCSLKNVLDVPDGVIMGSVYTYLRGTLINNGRNTHDEYYTLFDNNSTNYNGTLIDHSYPGTRYNEDSDQLVSIREGVSGIRNTLEIHSDHNMIVNIDHNDQIKELKQIALGLNGQIIKLKSNRLLEVISSNTILLNTNKRIFVGSGKNNVMGDYAIDIDSHIDASSQFKHAEVNTPKLINVFVRPVTVTTAQLFFQFIDYRGDGLGTIYDADIDISIVGVVRGTGTNTVLTDTIDAGNGSNKIKLRDLVWTAEVAGTTKKSQKFGLNTIINVNEYDSITLTVKTSSLYGHEDPNIAGETSATVYLKKIFDEYVFYPNGITLMKSSSGVWNEI